MHVLNLGILAHVDAGVLRGQLAGSTNGTARGAMAGTSRMPGGHHRHRILPSAERHAPGFNKNMSSVGADFRNLAPVLIHQALRRPAPSSANPSNGSVWRSPPPLPAVAAALAQAQGVILDTRPGHDVLELVGHIPTRCLPGLSGQLPDLARGEALTSELDHYQPVHGVPPERNRIGPDPLDRPTWFRERPR